MDFNAYKQSLLSYLEDFKKYEEEEIKAHEALSDQEKVEQGFLIENAKVANFDKKLRAGEFLTPVNNTRWRIGDKLRFESYPPFILTGTCYVSDNFSDRIFLSEMPVDSALLGKFKLSMQECSTTSVFINAIDKIEEFQSGSYFLDELNKNDEPCYSVLSPIDPIGITLRRELNQDQKKAFDDVMKCPSMYAIQGPPGTGKTDVLSAIAYAFSNAGHDVLVMSYSHQAVNNALNKVAEYDVPVVKIGSEYKAQSLNAIIKQFASSDLFKASRRKKRRGQVKGQVVGMTMHGAIIDFAIHGRSFLPTVVLVDEASQIPLAFGAAIGVIGASVNVFIGDNRQMPPIFHENISNDELSISIFEHLYNTLPDIFKTVLTTTYRMNRVICRYVSENFYEPHGIVLKSFEAIADNHVDDEDLKSSVEMVDIATSKCEDENEDEAKKAVEVGLMYRKKGLDVAIITPYRKQVNKIREMWNLAGGTSKDILIDTVERLQGQDVDVIILSFSVSDTEYYKTQDTFLLNKNRLNVMISRAKVKVVIIKSPLINIRPFLPLSIPEANASSSEMFEIANEPIEAREARKLILESFQDLEFFEDGHRYLLHGKSLNSVSQVSHRFESHPFDAETQAVIYAAKHGKTAKYWKDQWLCNSFRATTLGTKTHEFGESLAYLKAGHPEFIRPSMKVQYLEEKNYLADIHPKENAARLFLTELPSSYHLVLNETKVYSGKNPNLALNLKEQLCGTFDMLYWYDGDGNTSKAGFVVFDYKTNTSLYNDYSRKNDIMMLKPFEKMFQEAYSEYSIQLSLYSLMLEDIGLNVLERAIIWLKDDGTYEKITLPDLTDALRNTL